MFFKKSFRFLIFLSCGVGASFFYQNLSAEQGLVSKANVYRFEDSCRLGLDSGHIEMCKRLFEKTVVDSSQETILNSLSTPGERQEVTESAICKITESNYRQWKKAKDFQVKHDLKEFAEIRVDRTKRYFHHLIEFSQKIAQDANKHGFFIPFIKRLQEGVCVDTRLLTGDDGTAIKSIVNKLFRELSPVHTTFGYVSALEAVSSPMVDFDQLNTQKRKMQRLLADPKLLGELKELLGKFGSLEHAYFYLDKMPEPRAYDQALDKNHSNWECQVNSRAFKLKDWANIGILESWGRKAFTGSVWMKVGTNKLDFAVAIAFSAITLGLCTLNAAAKMGELSGLPISSRIYFTLKKTFGEEYLNINKLGDGGLRIFAYSSIVIAAFKNLIIPIASGVSEIATNPFYLRCKVNNLKNILWAQNLCVDIKEFLNLAMKIERKSHAVHIGDGKSITDGILYPKDKGLRDCLSCLLKSDVFKEKWTNDSVFSLFSRKAFSIDKILYVLVYLAQKNHSFMVDIARRVGEVDYLVSSVGLVLGSRGQKNGFNFVDFQKPIDGQAFVDCKGAWSPFVHHTKVVENDIHFGSRASEVDGLPVAPTKSVNGYILTGGNGCGKSVFATGVILSIILGQTLCIAPASSIHFTPFDEILTYVKVEADPVNEKSLFMSQLATAGRLAAFVDLIKKEEKLLFLWMDESLSGTRWSLGTAISQALLLKCFANQPHLSLIFATHLDLLARNCERRSDGSIMPIMIDAETTPDGLFLKSKYKVIKGVSTHDSAFSLIKSQWSAYPFCQEVCELALKEYKAIESIEEYGKRVAEQINFT